MIVTLTPHHKRLEQTYQASLGCVDHPEVIWGEAWSIQHLTFHLCHLYRAGLVVCQLVQLRSYYCLTLRQVTEVIKYTHHTHIVCLQHSLYTLKPHLYSVYDMLCIIKITF